jgi:hypothetical protein
MDDFRESIYMDQYDGKRDLYSALGYVEDPQYRHFRARYERTDVAPAIVDKLPQKAWSRPTIRDPASGDEESDFEEAVNDFLRGRYTEEDPVKVMERATRMERLGNFSLVFIGFNDEAVLDEVDDEEDGVDALEREVDESSLDEMDPSEAISYITPYDQARVDLDMVDWVDEDPTDPRFGKPRSYQVDLGENRPTAQIHWSRLIHVVGKVFDNELKSPSVLKRSLNRVDDIEKILGGSAEGYWRAAYQGMVISPPEINGKQTDFDDSGEELHKQIERYINNFSREIFTGADIDTIDANVEDPTGHLESQYADISAGHDIPQSILMGNETGERATQEDREMWHERVGDFRTDYCSPDVLRPVIERLIQYGVFPEPEGGIHSYKIEWPPLDEMSEQERANVIQTVSNAINTGTGGEPQLAVTMEEFRENVLGWKPDRGAETEGDSQLEAADPEDLTLDEDDDRVQAQFSRENKSLSVEEKVETPDGRGLIVDILEEGFDVEEGSVEATPSDPKYVVVTESEEKPFGYYTEDEVEPSEWETGVDEPEKDLKEEEGGERGNAIKIRVEQALAALRGRENVFGDGHFTWPESWRESDTPARLIALDAWVSMGGSVSGCIREMKGEVGDAGRFCGDFADRLYQWDYWRGDSWAPGE